MATFPTLTIGGVAMHNTSRSISYPTGLIRYRTGEEQRWVKYTPLASEMNLVFTNISQYDLSNIRAFYISNIGPFNATWSITIDGATYNNMAFLADGFEPTLGSLPDRWNLTLRVKQTI